VSHEHIKLRNSEFIKGGYFHPVDKKVKPIPEYVPTAIRSDIYEACEIESLSPKAAATLVRRALQGMIRDFWQVKPGRLVDEIDQIKDSIDALTWQTINAVRKIGNIGAHMEKDVNEIVDIDPNEAGVLIQLSYTLIAEWYIVRHERERRMKSIINMALEKK
jgi:hypothetical protein